MSNTKIPIRLINTSSGKDFEKALAYLVKKIDCDVYAFGQLSENERYALLDIRNGLQDYALNFARYIKLEKI